MTKLGARIFSPRIIRVHWIINPRQSRTHLQKESTPFYLPHVSLAFTVKSIWNLAGDWRPETMCPRTDVLGPLVPRLIVPRDTMSLDWYIPVIRHYTIRSGWCKIKRMFQCRDIVFPGQFIQGTRGSQKLRMGTHRSGRPVTHRNFTSCDGGMTCGCDVSILIICMRL